MNKTQTGNNHHFVQKALLKNFCIGNTKRAWTFDKRDCRSFTQHIDKIAAKRGFYDLPDDENIKCIEPGISEIENLGFPVIKSIIENKRVDHLSLEEREVLAFYVALQRVRTTWSRNSLRAHLEQSRDAVNARRDFFEQEHVEYSDQFIQSWAIRALIPTADEYARQLLSKKLLLFESREAVLMTSDCPVVLRNLIKANEFDMGAIGIEAYMPISSYLCLAFWCPILTAAHIKSSEDFAGVTQGVKPFDAPLATANMLNALQVLWSSRFLFCGEPAFEQATQMIARSPKLRGPFLATFKIIEKNM
jgi:hypothetical protein